MLGCNALYIHIQKTYTPPNSSPMGNSSYTLGDVAAEWLMYQEVNQRFQYRRKPRVVSSMMPIRLFHSFFLSLIWQHTRVKHHINPDPKPIWVAPLCLWGVYTRLD